MIKRENTLAVAVDLQEKLMPVIFESEKVLKAASRLVSGFNILGVSVLVTQHNTKGLGNTVKEVQSGLKGKEYFEKSSFSLYKTKEIKEYIDKSNKKNIIIFGAEAHVCVLLSLISLREAGYDVFLIKDACGSRCSEDKEAAVLRAVYEGAAISTVEAVLFELAETSDCDEFKKILKIVK
ncbi:MAG: isochorismatase family protein [Lachnospiraceae bacterium]|nr:isochorismatase family protein [Lachnospiraceae bacterium]